MSWQSKSMLNDMDKSVAKRIKIARLLRGFSQQHLAQALSISIQQIQKYESGKNRISSGRLYYLAQFLNLPITYFFNSIKDDAHLLSSADISEKQTINLINSFNSIKDAKLKKNLVAIIELISN